MQPVTVEKIAKVTGGQIVAGSGAIKVTGVSTDSRSLKTGDLFVALPGERVDGHTFVSASLAGPAVAALVSQAATMSARRGKGYPVPTPAGRCVGSLVSQPFSVRTVAITGSTARPRPRILLHRFWPADFQH